MSRTHDLKCWPGPFMAICEGRKWFELRRDDRGFEVGDLLRLRMWNPEIGDYITTTNEAGARVGIERSVEVQYILRAGEFPGLEPGFVIMGWRDDQIWIAEHLANMTRFYLDSVEARPEGPPGPQMEAARAEEAHWRAILRQRCDASIFAREMESEPRGIERCDKGALFRENRRLRGEVEGLLARLAAPEGSELAAARAEIKRRKAAEKRDRMAGARARAWLREIIAELEGAGSDWQPEEVRFVGIQLKRVLEDMEGGGDGDAEEKAEQKHE